MKFAFRMLMLLMMSVIANSIGAILDQYFDNQSSRINCVAVAAVISGYLVRGWWPPEKKEGAE
ncbi:hypothetical protein LT978_16560 [Bacillus amyloliquefaciens]|uniref:hypothetical protein n=1 Tax=Bacillus amyloliquefaciens group TaxID=1938374 RepID=UPI00208E783C|nr:hypothetical protein [Bacillus amyloliquefaciens]USP43600.1 hypothetical protein LT978_16225 [Bacillus amyloliquefaciens]USP43663.1 hypothetical protein LT978_16560 [Bacillus amyloliquefaciens]WOH97239.1 hypothetical protein R0744_18885 [Bacillus amyloliquefaciens]WOI49637.1 hypothetical protein R0833_17160 [Bacillus amyloliquefaciens]WOI65449.1 hypothetical protein R0887_17675 [Bacillus amyloliquefaciens]